MRGKDVDERSSRTDTGITPAYAGKSKRYERYSNALKDHPRLCGEKCCCMWCCKSGTGSPPPMRGKGSRLFTLGIRAGITPAYAGKSTGGGVQLQKIWDHPRLCGEKLMS